MTKDMIILTRCQQLLFWLLPHIDRFPSRYRFTINQRMINHLLDLAEGLNNAQFETLSKRIEQLHRCDRALQQLRFYLFMAVEQQWLSLGQYEHVSRMVVELGRMLGSWIKREQGER